MRDRVGGGRVGRDAAWWWRAAGRLRCLRTPEAQHPGLAATGYRMDGPVTWTLVPRPLWAARRRLKAADLHDWLAPQVHDPADVAALAAAALPVVRTGFRAPLIDAGVWVPDPRIPEVIGTMTVHLVVARLRDPPLTPAGWRSIIEPDRRRPGQVEWRSVEDAEVPAGPAVVAHERSAQRSRLPEDRIQWTIFPHGSRDAVQLSFSTPYTAWRQEMTEDAAVMARHVTVELGKADE